MQENGWEAKGKDIPLYAAEISSVVIESKKYVVGTFSR